MLNQLLLNSGNDIPFEEANLIIHPPTINEISYIGEDNLWPGVEFLNLSKDSLDIKDNSDLSFISDFEILLSVVNNESIETQIHYTQMELVLTLLFPQYKFVKTPRSFVFMEQDTKETHMIDKDNFNEFKKYIRAIFCLDQLKGNGERDYDPQGIIAAALAKKFKARRKTLAEIKRKNGEDTGLNILDLYVSTLSVGLQKDKNQLKQYTVYQLFDEFQRYNLKQSFDINMQARMAGATKLKDAENWMKNIHVESNDS